MISVGFSTTNSPISRIIRWVTGARVSHSFLAFHWLGVDWALEAGFTGVKMTPLSEFQKHSKIVESVHLPGVHLLDLKPALLDLGKSYDFGGLFGNLWIQIGRWLRLKFHNPTQDSRALFCSEFIVEFLKDIGWPGSEGLVAADTTPEDLRKFLKGE